MFREILKRLRGQGPLTPWRVLRLLFLAALSGLAVFVLYLDTRVREEFTGRRFALPAHVYARPLELFPGMRLDVRTLQDELNRLGYRTGLREVEPARYDMRGDGIELVTRAFVDSAGAQPARRLRVRFADGTISEVVDERGEAVTLARLDPRWIGGIYPAHNEDRILVRLAQVPQHLVHALIAIEDRRFREHWGIDPRGLARAAVATLTGRGIQGGSTITQQLVKNFFLTRERTLRRKFTEVLMAILLELHYGKDEILETYLNEIYLGQDRNRAIHGIGLAAQFLFGKPVEQLTLADSALLIGMVRGPAIYDPHRFAPRARERRDLVLSEMKNLGLIELSEYNAARTSALGVLDKPTAGASLHPAFIELVRRQLRRDYREEDLRSEGLIVYTTLDPQVQSAAEQGLAEQIARLDRPRRGAEKATPLEGAVVITNSQTGEVQALVGGRDSRFEGFNRALDAMRSIGSLLKPVIYLVALAQPERYTLVTQIDDGPLVWKSRGAPDWKPENYDKTSHGLVPLRTALERSYNLAAARLGLDVGIANVHRMAGRLGVDRQWPEYASSLLGAVPMTPIEVAQMYQTIAANGFRSPLRAIREVLTADGKPLTRYPLAVEQTVEPAPVYLLTEAMQGVVREGTARALNQWVPAEIGVAAKTGTTDELRDSWFAGFTGDRNAVVWVGNDDNRPTHLTGASGAMTVWGNIMGRLTHVPLALPQPESIERVWVDPSNGLRAGPICSGALELPFIVDSAPKGTSGCISAAGDAVRNAAP